MVAIKWQDNYDRGSRRPCGLPHRCKYLFPVERGEIALSSEECRHIQKKYPTNTSQRLVSSDLWIVDRYPSFLDGCGLVSRLDEPLATYQRWDWMSVFYFDPWLDNAILIGSCIGEFCSWTCGSSWTVMCLPISFFTLGNDYLGKLCTVDKTGKVSTITSCARRLFGEGRTIAMTDSKALLFVIFDFIHSSWTVCHVFQK